MQTVSRRDSLHKLLFMETVFQRDNLRQILFSGKNKKTKFKMSSAAIYTRYAKW